MYELKESGSREIEDYEAKFEELIMSLHDGTNPSDSEVAEGLKAATEFVRASGKV